MGPNSTAICLLFISRFSSSSAYPKLKNISYGHRARALKEARSALTEYLHSTRSLPFALAYHMATNSPHSLSLLLSQIPPPIPCPSLLPSLLRRFLAYHFVNEFDFFSESIGLRHQDDPIPFPSPFLSDHPRLLPAVSALAGFGFPWPLLGLLRSAFDRDHDLLARLRQLDSLGLRRVCVIGICLAFPWVLNASDPNADLLFRDLRTVFVDYGLDELAGNDVEGVYGICRRIRVLYDAGSEMGRMGELMGREKRVFLEVGEEVLKQKLGFFLKMGMEKEKAGGFVLENSEIFYLDLESPDIAMPEFLISVGFDKEEVAELSKKYPHVMGKNKLGNLPGILQAMDLHRWFLHKIARGNVCYLTPEFAAASVLESRARKSEEEFLEDIEQIKSKKRKEHVDNKLEFFFSIGFGKNKITSKALSAVYGTKDQLQERFDCLIELGIGYTVLCRMISVTPKLMNHRTESIHEKVNYLCHELGYHLEYLDSFPAFLCFDLENRIKPRFKIMNWLIESGLLKKHFSPSTILGTAEKTFIIILYGIHPAAPKQWLETFSSRSVHCGNQRNLV